MTEAFLDTYSYTRRQGLALEEKVANLECCGNCDLRQTIDCKFDRTDERGAGSRCSDWENDKWVKKDREL